MALLNRSSNAATDLKQGNVRGVEVQRSEQSYQHKDTCHGVDNTYAALEQTTLEMVSCRAVNGAANALTNRATSDRYSVKNISPGSGETLSNSVCQNRYQHVQSKEGRETRERPAEEMNERRLNLSAKPGGKER